MKIIKISVAFVLCAIPLFAAIPALPFTSRAAAPVVYRNQIDNDGSVKE